MGKQKIEILIATKAWDPKPWAERISESELVDKVHIWPTDEDLSNVEALFVWKPMDSGVLERLPNLKWVSSLGAGVDHLVRDKQIPKHIPITRIVDPNLTRDMTNYCILGVMMYQRSMDQHRSNQQNAVWDRLPYANLNVGVLGLGELGAHCAKHLALLGFNVSGFSRTPKAIDGVNCHSEDQMNDFLKPLDVLINLLPVTPQTESILNAELFNEMKKGSYLINVARGNHLVEQDLIENLDNYHLSGALLDVFREEPLPTDHPFWTHSKVKITPHVASVSDPNSVIKLLLENADRLIEGKELLNQIDKNAGY